MTFMDKNKFSSLVEDEIRTRQITPIEAIIRLCEEREIEVESVSSLLTPKIKALVKNEASKMNLLKSDKSSRLY